MSQSSRKQTGGGDPGVGGGPAGRNMGRSAVDLAESTKSTGAAAESADPVPLCMYFLRHGSCLNDPSVGGDCPFKHVLPTGVTLAEARKNTKCPHFFKGKIGRKSKCRYGDLCMFSHDTSTRRSRRREKAAKQKQDDEEEGEPCCNVCLEIPAISDDPEKWARYALLPGCDHAFCVSCLKQWREANKNNDGSSSVSILGDDKKKMVKCCPACRAPSRFCVPSDKFYKGKRKEKVIERYRAYKARKPCSKFDRTLGSCPFGRECFYAHLDLNGQDIKSQDESADVLFQRREEEYHRRQRNRRMRRLGIDDENDEAALMRGFMSLLQMFGDDGEDGDWTELDPREAAMALEVIGIPRAAEALVAQRSGSGGGGGREPSGSRRRRRGQGGGGSGYPDVPGRFREGWFGGDEDVDEQEDDHTEESGQWLVNVD